MRRMPVLKHVFSVFLAVLGAVALAFVVGIVDPHKKVNGLWLVVAAGGVQHVMFIAAQC
jgi:zinc transporter ZupT